MSFTHDVDVGALRSFLASELRPPMCDADPSVLMTYILALLENNWPKGLDAIHGICVDELREFMNPDARHFAARLASFLHKYAAQRDSGREQRHSGGGDSRRRSRSRSPPQRRRPRSRSPRARSRSPRARSRSPHARSRSPPTHHHRRESPPPEITERDCPRYINEGFCYDRECRFEHDRKKKGLRAPPRGRGRGRGRGGFGSQHEQQQQQQYGVPGMRGGRGRGVLGRGGVMGGGPRGGGAMGGGRGGVSPRFDLARVGRRPEVRDGIEKEVLITSVPPEQHNEGAVRSYFSRFGQVRSVEVAGGGRERVAIVRYATATAALRAVRDPAAPWNNRFVQIKFTQHQAKERALVVAQQEEEDGGGGGGARANLANGANQLIGEAEQAARAAAEREVLVMQQRRAELRQSQLEEQRRVVELLGSKTLTQEKRAELMAMSKLLEQQIADGLAADQKQMAGVAAHGPLSSASKRKRAESAAVAAPGDGDDDDEAAHDGEAEAKRAEIEEKRQQLEGELAAMRQQALAAGIELPAAGAFGRGRGRGARGRGGRGRGRGRGAANRSMTLDNRTTSLQVDLGAVAADGGQKSAEDRLREVAGVHAGELADVRVDADAQRAIVTFQSRRAAAAVLHSLNEGAQGAATWHGAVRDASILGTAPGAAGAGGDDEEGDDDDDDDEEEDDFAADAFADE